MQKGLKKPAMRYAALRPWIDLANVANRLRPENEPPHALIEAVEREKQTPWFPRAAILALANDLDDRAAGWQALDALAVKVFTALHGLAESGSKAHLRFYDKASKYDLAVENGTVQVKVLAPFAAFAEALKGAEVDRIRHCPICQALFYAARATRNACSERCNRVLRVRRFRSNQEKYRDNRKWNEHARALRKGAKGRDR